MLTRIRTSAAGAPSVEELLLACHDRIRHFVGLARRLAAPGEAPAAEIAEAAAGVHRYFSLALPLHAADEEQSIRPRLDVPAMPAEVRRAVATMTEEHRPMERVLDDALPMWEALGREPGRQADLASRLAEHAERLDALFAAHLPPEESIIFPALRRLDPGDLAELRDEMRRRRT